MLAENWGLSTPISKFGTFAFIYLKSPINSSKRLVYLHQPTKKLMTKLKTVVYVVML